MATFTDLDRDLTSTNNDVVVKEDVLAINNAITNILSTYPGEIPGRPNFGSRIQEYLHEFIDEITISGIEEEVENVLLEFEERIEVQDVVVKGIQEDEIIVVNIYYTVLSNGQEAFYSNTFEVL
jgi:phage baseplate assembly protein W